MDQYEFITPVPPMCSDVECQCRALAYVSYHIDHVEVRDFLLLENSINWQKCWMQNIKS